MAFILGFGLRYLQYPYTQSILGWTATDAGLLLIPWSITTAFMMPIIKLIQRECRKDT
jgi:DHA2 family multidrug resistance protein